MRHLSKLLALVLIIPVAVFAETPAAQPPEVQSLADQLQKRLADVQSLHASFVQITQDFEGKPIQNSEGELWLTSANESPKFRIETRVPFEQLLISDGVDFWSYDAALEQLVISRLDQDVSKMPILLFGNQEAELLSNYQLTFFEDEDAQHFILVPKATDSLFEQLTIVFNDAIPVEISLRDSLGQHTKIRFINPEVNAETPRGTFEFKTPDNIDVIDDR